jgi:hypothetical protein
MQITSAWPLDGWTWPEMNDRVIRKITKDFEERKKKVEIFLRSYEDPWRFVQTKAVGKLCEDPKKFPRQISGDFLSTSDYLELFEQLQYHQAKFYSRRSHVLLSRFPLKPIIRWSTVSSCMIRFILLLYSLLFFYSYFKCPERWGIAFLDSKASENGITYQANNLPESEASR